MNTDGVDQTTNWKKQTLPGSKSFGRGKKKKKTEEERKALKGWGEG